MPIANPNTDTASFGTTEETLTAVLTLAGTSVDDAPTETFLIATGGANKAGSLISLLSAIPRGLVTATKLNLFLSSDSGTTKRLFASVTMPAQSITTILATVATVFLLPDGLTKIDEDNVLRLKTGEELYVNSEVAITEGIVVTCKRTDF